MNKLDVLRRLGATEEQLARIEKEGIDNYIICIGTEGLTLEERKKVSAVPFPTWIHLIPDTDECWAMRNFTSTVKNTRLAKELDELL